MRSSDLVILVVICTAIGIAGCNPVESKKTAETSDLRQDSNGNESNDASETQTARDGWAIYSPPEKDFSVVAPENSVKVDFRDTPGFGKWRSYVFKLNGASLSVQIHSERTGTLAGNSVEELKADTSDIVPGSLKDIKLLSIPGVEFRMKGAIGESVFREYCPDDNSRTITLQVAKDLGDGLTEDEVRLFLDSFKLLP